MEELKLIIIPVVELIGVILVCVILVSLLIWGLLSVLRIISHFGFSEQFHLMIATRILVGYQREGRKLRNLLFPISSQNFIAMVGIALGVWALIVVLSVMGGFEEDLKTKIVKQSPHIMIRPKDLGVDIDLKESLETAKKQVDCEIAETYLEGEVMITAPTNMSPGAILRGLDMDGGLVKKWLLTTASEKTINNLKKPILLVPDRDLGFEQKADTSTPKDETMDEVMPPIPLSTPKRGKIMPGIILGEEMAKSLSVITGDEVMVIVPDGDIGPQGIRPKVKTFRVAGTFVSGLYEYDLKMAYIRMEDALTLFSKDYPNRGALLLDDIDKLEDALSRISLPEQVEAVSVAIMNRSLFSALKLEKIAMFLVLGLVILVAAFNVFSSLELITMEKTGQIAILRSLGASSKGVMGIFIALGGAIGLIGTIGGGILGILSCLYVSMAGITLPQEYYLRTLPVAIRVSEILIIMFATISFSFLATLIPSISAQMVTPAEGLRND